ncbi:MAG: DUF4190 domain-containing protein [Candidatus Lokiarchaeota archaeon]|nr:DUF4190 domain-containing protein [Candidatus Lokiarchaeota archaeon]
MGKTFGILALIFGILGFFAWIIFLFIPFNLPYSGFYIPGAAIVFGIIGIIVDDSKGMAIAGLVLGCIAIVFVWFVIPILILMFFFALIP